MSARVALWLSFLLVCCAAGASAADRSNEAPAGVSSCRAVQLQAQAAVQAGGPYRNHGDLVSTAAHVVSAAVRSRAIDEACAGCIMNQFACAIPIPDQKPCPVCPAGALTADASGASLPDPTTMLAAISIANHGALSAENVQVTSITLNGGTLASPTLPVNLGAIPADGVTTLDADITGAFAPLGTYALALAGTYTVGGASSCFTLHVTLSVPAAAPGSAPLQTAPAPPHRVSGAPFPPEPPSMGEEVNGEIGWVVPTGPLVPGSPSPSPTEVGPIPQEGFRIEGVSPVVFTVNRPLGFPANQTYAEPSGASGGGVVFMTVNSFSAFSTNAGASFTQLSPTTIFPNNFDGGFCCDQVVTYVPSIDRFIWVMQFHKAGGTNRMRIASASPADIINSGGTAWTYWDLTSGFFGFTGWLDYPDLSVGNNYLYLSCQEVHVGLIVVRMPLGQIQASGTVFVQWTDPTRSPMGCFSHITQVTGNEIFWAGHNSNSSMRIFSWAEGSNSYFWRDRSLFRSWSTAALSSMTPDGRNWIKPGNRDSPSFPAVVGATRTGDEIWFAWTAGTDNFFHQPHVEMVRFNRTRNFSLLQQVQIWNNSYAFAYPALSTNECTNEVGLSLEYGGNGHYENHVVGFWGDFLVYVTTASNDGLTRFGDYVTIRQHPENVGTGTMFDAFGYGFKSGPSGGQTDVRYVSFGRPGNPCIIYAPDRPRATAVGAEVEGPAATQAGDLAIQGITPNPVAQYGSIAFVTPRRDHVRAAVYDLQGRVVGTLLDEVLDAGFHVLRWPPAAGQGPRLTPGTYLISVSTTTSSVARKVVVLE